LQRRFRTPARDRQGDVAVTTTSTSVPEHDAPASRHSAVARRTAWLSAGLLLAGVGLLLLLYLSMTVGTKHIPVQTVWTALVAYDGSDDHLIVRELRVPRTLLGVLVGSSMGLAGALMQALTRNPLADPGLLGVNAGAALAIVVAIYHLGAGTLNEYVWFGIIGAGGATVLVYLLGAAGRAGASPVRLALAGTAIAAAFTGIISAIVLLSHDVFVDFRTWSVGSLTGRNLDVVVQVAPFIALGTLVALLLAGPLNALSLGDDTARALGAKVAQVRLAGVVAVTLLCGAGTAAVGPIGFVGLIVPHMVRAFTGPNQRWLLPYSALLGAALLLGSDVLGRVALHPGELQVGVVTAAVGAPFFIALVRRRRLSEL
jgi:iron complex transport system permease protein